MKIGDKKRLSCPLPEQQIIEGIMEKNCDLYTTVYRNMSLLLHYECVLLHSIDKFTVHESEKLEEKIQMLYTLFTLGHPRLKLSLPSDKQLGTT